MGLLLERKKDASLLNWNPKRTFIPEKIRVPLRPHSRVCVHTGDTVRLGQVLATPGHEGEVTTHAGIAGTVTGALTVPDGAGGMKDMIEIQGVPDPKARPGSWEPRKDWEQTSKEELSTAFQTAGLVTTDAVSVPVHLKIQQHLAARTVIINACEPEPYVTSEQTLVLSHPLEILKGAELLRKALDAENICFAFESCDFEMREIIKSKIFFLKWQHAEVRTVPALYPQGVEATLLRRWFAGREAEAVVFPASTAFAAYEAVVCQKPFFERIVTVGGECVVEPRSLWLPLGTLFQAAIQACKGLMREPGKVVMNGPMAGPAQEDLKMPVTASTAAILALPKELVQGGAEEPCIRCNLCADKCPVGISPAMVTLAAEQNEFETAKLFGAADCIECGNCGYVCPSKRPMLAFLRKAKKTLKFFSANDTARAYGRA